MSYYQAIKKHAKSKKAAQAIHAKKRAAERYNVVLSTSDLDLMVKYIQSGRCNLLQKQTNRVSLFEVDAHGKTYRVAYDRNRHSIITFLPKENI